MSLYAALQVAVGGLAAQSSSIGNISDNLANSQTTGYKGIGTRFESLVTQSSATMNDPGGVIATPYYSNGDQGTISEDSSATSLAISGSGYFPVRAPIVGSDGLATFGNTTYFTRAGDFALDKNGYLVNSGNYYLTGYTVDAASVVDSSSVNAIQISALLDNPVGTSVLEYAANLPSSAAVNFESSPSTIEIYDDIGGSHDMAFTWTKTATNTWNLNLLIPDGVSDGGGPPTYTDYDVDIVYTFNTGANAGTIASIAADTTVPAQWTVVDNTAEAINMAELEITLSFEGVGDQTISLDFGTYDTSDGVTQFADTTVSVTTLDQNGIPRGSFQGLAIDENGFVTLNYDNGRSRTIAQIPIVQFFAQNQLQRLSGGAFSQTLASGSARYAAAGTNGGGTISGYALEGSNVDIAEEFTKLIQAQQIYSANAKTITTANNMMQEAINIIR